MLNMHTHTHPFNGPLSGTTRVSQYQEGKTNLDFTGARDSEWQWHQLGHMQVCTSLQTDNHTSTSLISFLQADALLLPNQQRQSTEGIYAKYAWIHNAYRNYSCHMALRQPSLKTLQQTDHSSSSTQLLYN